MPRTREGEEQADRGAAATGKFPPQSAVGDSIGGQSVTKPIPLDGYQFVGRLGAGGMGSVWRAVQASTGREVALKLLNSSELNSDDARKRFEREVEVASRLTHPNIARVYDSGINEGAYFYTMELVEGVPLDQFVETRKLDRRSVLKLMSAIGRAIQYAHQRGVIHRDLKPSNILVDESGTPHVVDFGLGKLSREYAPLESISVVGQWVGTPAYMSPEQAAGRSDQVDTRTDVYSLGVILYQLMTGRLPHDPAGEHLAVLHRVVNEEIVRPRKISRSVNWEIEAVILKALSKSAEDRYSSAGALADDIDNYLAAEPISIRRTSSIYFLRKKMARHWVSLSLAGLALAGIVCVVVIASIRVARERNLAIAANAKTDLLLHESNRALANSLVTSSDLLRKNGRWREARDIGWQAYQLQRAEGGETTNFALGLLQIERNAPIEVNRYSNYVTEDPPIMAAYFSADGRTVQFPLASGIVDTFDPVTGRIVRAMGLKYSWGQNTCVTRSSDGRYLYRHTQIFTPGEPPCRFDRVDLSNGNIQKTDLAHDFQEVPGTIATDGTDVVACLIEKTKTKQDQRDLWMISLTGSDKPRVLTVPSGKFTTAISFSTDLHTLAVGNTKGMVDLYKAAANPQPQPLAEFNLADAAGFDGVEHINYVPDGSGMVLADKGGKLGFISLKSAPQFRKFGECDSKVEVIGFSRDSRFVLTGDDSGTVGLWDVATGKRLRAFYADQRIDLVEMSPDQQVLIAVTLYGHVFTWPVDLLDENVLTINTEPVSQMAASSDGLLAATAMEDRVQVYDVPTNRLLRKLKANGNVTSMAFSKTGSMLKVATDAGEITQTDVFDSNSKGPDVELVGPTIYSAQGIPGRKHTVFLTPDSEAAIDLTDVTAARIDLVTGYQTSIRRTLAGTAAGISNDGYTVITIPSVGQIRRTFCLYDFLGQKERAIPVEEIYPLTAIAISSDGKTSYIALSDGRLQARDLADGKVLWQTASHQRGIRCIRVSPGGHTLLSGGDDGTLQLWDAQSGSNLRTVADGLGKISAVYFSPGGDLILCNGAPGNGACIWDLSQPQLLHDAAAAATRALLAIKGNPGNDSAAVTLVDWYSRRGMAEWARDLLDERSLDQRAGLAAARCRLQLHDDDSAGPDFKALVGQKIPGVSDAYLEACSRAAKVIQY